MSTPRASVTFTVDAKTDYSGFHDSRDDDGDNFTGLYLGGINGVLMWFGSTNEPIERHVEAIDRLTAALVDLRARKVARLDAAALDPNPVDDSPPGSDDEVRFGTSPLSSRRAAEAGGMAGVS